MSQSPSGRRRKGRFPGLFGKRGPPEEDSDVEAAAVVKHSGASPEPERRYRGFLGGFIAGFLREPREDASDVSDEWLVSPRRGRSRPRRMSHSRSRDTSTSGSSTRDDPVHEESEFPEGPSLGIFDINNHDGSVECVWLDSLDKEARRLPRLSPIRRSTTRLTVEDTYDITAHGERNRDKVQLQNRLKRRRRKEGKGVDDYLRPLYRTRQKETNHLGSNFDAKFQWRIRERFDLWRMQNLLQETRSNIFTIQVIRDCAPGFMTRSVGPVPGWSQSGSFSFHTIYVDRKKRFQRPGFGHFAIFVTTKPDRRGNLRMRCEFPANDREDDPFPTRDLFEELLLDDTRSALAFACDSSKLTHMLILVDLLRASIDTWHTALQHLAKWSTITTASITMFPSTALQADAGTIDGLASSVNDMAACTDHLLNMIETSFDIASDKIKRWNNLKFEISAKMNSLRSTINDIRRDHERRVMLADGEWNKQQALSAKRLTLVASIFLPLALASSLLSMSTRARDLGNLWYDWVGICLAMGFATLVPYQVHRGAQMWWIKNRHMTVQLRGLITVKARGLSLRALVLRYFPILFKLEMVVVVASFLTGMFFNVGTGLRILGGSAAGTLLLISLPPVARLVRFFWREYWRGGLNMDNLKGLVTVIMMMISRRNRKKRFRRRGRRDSDVGSSDTDSYSDSDR